MRYDANEQPHSETWLELDESERIDRVIDYHRRNGVKLESLELHAITHVVVKPNCAGRRDAGAHDARSADRRWS